YLDVVGRVPREPEVGKVEGARHGGAAAGHVAEDLLLVLVDEGDGAGGDDVDQLPQPVDHLVAAGVRVGARPHEEGEDPDVGRPEGLGHVRGATHPLEVCRDVVVEVNLADRGADARDLQPVVGEHAGGGGEL